MRREIANAIVLGLMAFPAVVVAVTFMVKSLTITSDTLFLGKLIFLPVLVAALVLGWRLIRGATGMWKIIHLLLVLANTVSVAWLAYRFTG